MPQFTDLLFYALAGLTLLFAFLTVLNPLSRSPVTSAMFLVLTIISMAGLFVLLHAFFLAAVQVLVYAGAVMVVFLFVIMLLDLKEDERRQFNTLAVGLGGLSALAIAGTLVASVVRTVPAAAPAGRLQKTANVLTQPKAPQGPASWRGPERDSNVVTSLSMAGVS